MYHLSSTSNRRILQAHRDFIVLFKHDILKYVDFTVGCSFRDEEEQNQAKRDGRSQLSWPFSKHNTLPSLSVDIYPYINGRMVNGDRPSDKCDMCYFAGFVMGRALYLYDRGKIEHKIIWGGDWNGNFTIGDNFQDLPHYELKRQGV